MNADFLICFGLGAAIGALMVGGPVYMICLYLDQNYLLVHRSQKHD